MSDTKRDTLQRLDHGQLDQAAGGYRLGPPAGFWPYGGGHPAPYSPWGYGPTYPAYGYGGYGGYGGYRGYRGFWPARW